MYAYIRKVKKKTAVEEIEFWVSFKFTKAKNLQNEIRMNATGEN